MGQRLQERRRRRLLPQQRTRAPALRMRTRATAQPAAHPMTRHLERQPREEPGEIPGEAEAVAAQGERVEVRWQVFRAGQGLATKQ